MAYEMTIKERLRKYVSFLSIPRNEFEMRIKSSGGFLSKNIEPNGKLSVLPLADSRPATPKDMGIKVKKDELALNVISDGNVIKGSLDALGYDETWLGRELARLGGEKDVKKIYLATLTESGTLTVFPYSDPPKMADSLE